MSNRTKENAQRNELFDAAAAPPSRSAAAYDEYRRTQHMTNHELLQEAVNTHEDTTKTLENGLRIVENAKQVQAATGQALYDQGKQIDRAQGNLNKMKEDVKYSEKLLTYMRRCCCCACFGDPEHKRETQWAKRVDNDLQDAHYAQTVSKVSTKDSAQKAAAPVRQKYQNSSTPSMDTSGLADAGYGAEAAALDAETRQQDRYLSQIEEGLDVLHRGALAQKDELERQRPAVNQVLDQSEDLNARVRDMNDRSQLRRFK